MCLFALKSDIFNVCFSIVMLSMVTSSSESCRIDSKLSQTKDMKIGICCLSANQADLGLFVLKDWMKK